MEKDITSMKFLNNNIVRPETESLLHLLQEYKGPKDICLEVGSYCGHSTFTFAKFFTKVYAVDLWTNDYDVNDPASKSAEDAYTYFLKNMFLVNNVYPIKKSSVMASNLFEDNSIDMIYIDGCHQYPSVKNDIFVWLPKVKIGGMLCGHDYGQTGDRASVTQAVKEKFENKIKVIDDIEWCYIKENNI